jgi:predicted AlkP superfamily pyrophosphatase or phosphodiesterase
VRAVNRLLGFLLALVLGACRSALPPPTTSPANSGAGARNPIVVLVSIDGWRYDYFDRFQPPALSRLAGRGVRAEGLIPQFPSKTFPNHYTLVTGLRLANHGIVSNNMVSPDLPGRFAMSNREVISDPRWWGGEPIWNTAERQGRVAAALFWPGSEAPINGRRPTFWMKYDDDLPHRARVAQILEWLSLPEGRRPSFLTLYYSDVDNAGHRFGPDSGEVHEAALRVDLSLGELVAGVEAMGLSDRVNYVVVSDHGMAALSPDRVIVLDDYINVEDADIIDWSPVLGLSPKDGDVERLYRALKDKDKALAVYRRSEIPSVYGLANHPRVAPIVGIADEGWTIASRGEVAKWAEPKGRAPGGNHGYDARAKSMQGLFIASGPRVRSGLVVKPFENIHVYDLMCALLAIVPARNDGDPEVTRGLLR